MPVFQKDIAHAEAISFKYLDQIIAELKSAGLIETAGGKKSGYRLTKSPSEITVYDIYKAFNSDLKILDCIDNDICSKTKNCAAQIFWSSLNDTIKQEMLNTTLKELAEKQNKINQQEQYLMFNI
jgi:Rrf2 family protein